MKKEEAANIIKQVIDAAVQKGVFARSDDVVAAHNAFNVLIYPNIDINKQES